MSPTRLLDLFCGAGGATKGYQRAGFYVVGVDIKPQPRYCGDEFIQADAMTYPLGGFDAIHASPPCQAFSAMTRGRWQDREHPDYIAGIRRRLLEAGVPYVLENVPGAPLRNALLLCGTMFGLQTREGSQLRRHRLFESPWLFVLIPQCQHNDGSAIGVYGGGQHPERRRPATIGVWGNAGGFSKRDNLAHYDTKARAEVMGIDWMCGPELSEAIPPAYTEWIGRELLRVLAAVA
jgi:DNA (cytosine-5)-methyltransferase 1